MDVFTQGEGVDFVRTFTVTQGHTLSTASATLTLLDPTGATHSVTLAAPTIDTVAGTAAFAGYYQIPEGDATAGLWCERWETSGSIVDAVDVFFYVRHSPVVVAQA